MKRELIGYCDVDAGLIFIGDPCYQSDDKCNFTDWSKFCDNLHNNRVNDVLKIKHDLGHEGKGIVVQTAYGDGSYPVYVKRDKDGRIKEMTIKF